MTTTLTLPVPTADDMLHLGTTLGKTLHPGDLIILTGPLGAGKTTLTRGLGEGLGVRGAVTSPTFVISRVHPSETNGPSLVHVDAYRLTSPDDVDGLGLEDWMHDSVIVAEWGEDRIEHLNPSRLHITINRDATDDSRTVTLTGHGTNWSAERLHPLQAAN